jgi:hypothetical protein
VTSADVPRSHGSQHLPQRCPHVDGVAVVDVGILYGKLLGIRGAEFGAEQKLDVPVGNDAFELVIFRDRKMMDMVFEHELSGLGDRSRELDGVGERRHGRFELRFLHQAAGSGSALAGAVDAAAGIGQSLQSLLTDGLPASLANQIGVCINSFQGVIDLNELLADLPVQSDEGLSVFQLHRLLGEILRQRLVPVSGVAGNALLPVREFRPARLQPRFGFLCVHCMLRVRPA